MSRDYLLQYGTSAFVGRFRSDVELVRGRRAVVESPRGRELATVLCEPAAGPADLDGRVVREATAADEEASDAAGDLARRVFDAAALGDEPAAVLDCEVLLEASAAILHVAAWGTVDLTPLAERLSAQFQLPVRLHDVGTAAVAADPHGCGKPDCGSGGGGCGTGGGCSTGGCSRGQVKSSGELTAYFRDLRAKMEADAPGRRGLL